MLLNISGNIQQESVCGMKSMKLTRDLFLFTVEIIMSLVTPGRVDKGIKQFCQRGLHIPSAWLVIVLCIFVLHCV